MKEGQYSRTAIGAAVLRANHYLNTCDPVFSDPYAYDFTSDGWRKLLDNKFVIKFINAKPVASRLGLLTSQIVARSRFTEDRLKQAIKNGIQQYIIVGAGLDSFILREAENYPDLTIFEVDHPDTQAEKQKKLLALGHIPNNVKFVPVDFEKESVADALLKSSYCSNTKSFFSWLGTTHYLLPKTTLETLNSIIKITQLESEVVLDYSIHYQELNGIERLGSIALSKFTQYLEEPLLGNFKINELHQDVNLMGYDVLDDLSGDDLNVLYFNQRREQILHTSATHMLHLQVKRK